jgi:hypothetical protein
MQDIDKDKVYSLISKVARREESELKSLGTGVFLMQEKAFVYMVGKEIANYAKDLFGKGISWYTEKQIVNESGITDLIVEVNSNLCLAIEFKTRGTEDSYVNDIKKLRKIPDNYQKIFCALVDVYPEKDVKDDKRIKAVEAEKEKLVGRLCKKEFFDSFSTTNYGYSSPEQICCVVAAWEVKSKES